MASGPPAVWTRMPFMDGLLLAGPKWNHTGNPADDAIEIIASHHPMRDAATLHAAHGAEILTMRSCPSRWHEGCDSSTVTKRSSAELGLSTHHISMERPSVSQAVGAGFIATVLTMLLPFGGPAVGAPSID